MQQFVANRARNERQQREICQRHNLPATCLSFWYLHVIYYLYARFVSYKLWTQPEKLLLAVSVSSLSVSVPLSSLVSRLFLGLGQPNASSNDAQLKTENADAAKTAANCDVGVVSAAVLVCTLLPWGYSKIPIHLGWLGNSSTSS